MPLTIMIDIDGVLNTLDTTVLEVYNEDSGDNLRPKDITEYHIEKFVKPEYRESFKNYFLDKRVWRRIEVVKYACEVLNKLWDEGYNLIFVTKTECENMVKKRNWLNRNFPFMGTDNIRKRLYSAPKKQFIRADIAIDDGLFNLVGDRTYYSICFDKPYNQTDELIPCFTRVYDWLGVYTAVHEITDLLKENENDDVTP
jgi:5'(3')-deoxyribonucleotidase